MGLLFYIPEQDERRIGNSEFSAPSGGRNLEVVVIIVVVIIVVVVIIAVVIVVVIVVIIVVIVVVIVVIIINCMYICCYCKSHTITCKSYLYYAYLYSLILILLVGGNKLMIDPLSTD